MAGKVAVRFASAFLCSAVCIVTGCSRQTTQAGGLEVVLETNLSMPTDFDTLEVEVRQRATGGTWTALLNYPYTVTSQTSLPRTVSIAAGSGPNQEVLIDVTARKGGSSGAVIVLREIEVQIPTNRVAELDVLLASICAGVLDCPAAQSCNPKTGQCGPDAVNLTTLPDYNPHFDASLEPVPIDGSAGTHPVGDASAGDDATLPVDDGGAETEAADAGPAADCLSAQLNCNGSCIPNDVRNCGMCGHDCTALANVTGSLTCVSGACTFAPSACKAGFAHCMSNSDLGCETDITKPTNCGTCGSTCPSGDPNCAASGSSYGCVSGCPVATPTLCASTSTCVDTSKDPQNCASCGHVCATTVVGAVTTCAQGSCGFACTSSNPNACPSACVNFSSDTLNCGGCGKSCPAPTSGSGSAACSSGACALNCGAGLTSCDGACVDEQVDGKNCASCGNSCQGGACTGGICQPLVLASGQNSPCGIAVDSTNVYWANTGPTAGGTVMKVPIGGGTSTTLATMTSGEWPYNVAVQGGNLYFTTSDGTSTSGSVLSVATGGGVVATLLTGSGTQTAAMTTDTSNVYWTTSNALMYVPLSGGTATTIGSGGRGGVAIRGVHAYWSNLSSVIASGFANCTITKGACSPVTLATGGEIIGVAVDSTSVYYTDANNPGGTVLKVPLAGGTAVTLAQNQNGPWMIAVDASNVYWVNYGTMGGSVGSVMKVPLGGGTPVTLATQQGSPEFLTVDDTSVYWTNQSSGTVMKIAK